MQASAQISGRIDTAHEANSVQRWVSAVDAPSRKRLPIYSQSAWSTLTTVVINACVSYAVVVVVEVKFRPFRSDKVMTVAGIVGGESFSNLRSSGGF